MTDPPFWSDLQRTTYDLDRARELLRAWLDQCAAMGGGPRADLTERTLDLLGEREATDVQE